MAYWLRRGIQDRNENFEREFDSRWWINFRKFEFLSKSCTITAVVTYRRYPVTPSRQQPKYARDGYTVASYLRVNSPVCFSLITDWLIIDLDTQDCCLPSPFHHPSPYISRSAYVLVLRTQRSRETVSDPDLLRKKTPKVLHMHTWTPRTMKT